MSVVYFVQAGSDGPIKVGTTRDLSERIKSMATDNHEHIVVLGSIPGDQKLEKAIHRHLWRSRKKLEWFKPNSEVLSFVSLATSTSRAELDEELAKGAQRRLDYFAELDRFGVCYANAARFCVKHLASRLGWKVIAEKTRLPVSTLESFARSKGGNIVTYLALRDAYPEAFGLADLLTLDLTPAEVQQNRSTLESARDAIEQQLAKLTVRAA